MKKFKAFFDGACEPINPGGTAGLGAVVFENGKRVWEYSDLIPPSPQTSNNVAEYLAFVAILDYLSERKVFKNKIIIYGDSNLVIQQCFGSWKIKKGFYIEIAKEARCKLKQFKNISGVWISREKNQIADELSKREMKKANVEFRIQPEI